MAATLQKNHLHSPEAVLKAALEALACCRTRQISLDEYLDDLSQDMLLRRRLSNLLFTYYRHRRQVTCAIDACCSKKPEQKLYDLLTAALTMAAFQDSLAPESVVNIAVTLARKEFGQYAAKFTNAVLRKALEKLKNDNDMPALPPVLAKRWQKRFPAEEFQRLNELFLTNAPATVRLRNNFDAGILPEEALAEAIAIEAPWQFFRCRDLNALIRSEAMRDGAFYIQDPAPGKVCALLNEALPWLPDKGNFIDLCAAPGGKLIMTMELLSAAGKVYQATALDRSPRRLQLVKENLQRCRLSCRTMAGDAAGWFSGTCFELVCCDVPCSNTGVFRRRPDALWRWQLKDLSDTVKLQSAILNNAAQLTAPGGLLLYSTCSLEPEENELQIGQFLQQHPGFELVNSQLFMPDEFCDGTFAALLQKKSEALL
ncbi:MAG: hypothetical protein E7047_03520 [Lentisphaerae bacterium]|nr:hypothetical protein [Lentisphaerota bacterium]